MQTIHNFKLPLLPAKHIFFQKAVLCAEAVRLFFLFPPIEFCSPFTCIAEHDSQLQSSKYSFSHFAIKGTKNSRVCLAQTT